VGQRVGGHARRSTEHLFDAQPRIEGTAREQAGDVGQRFVVAGTSGSLPGAAGARLTAVSYAGAALVLALALA
jgi:hypothetical protein